MVTTTTPLSQRGTQAASASQPVHRTRPVCLSVLAKFPPSVADQPADEQNRNTAGYEFSSAQRSWHCAQHTATGTATAGHPNLRAFGLWGSSFRESSCHARLDQTLEASASARCPPES